VEKLLREIRVGEALISLGGCISTEDERGKQTHYYVGLFWNPWECPTGRTVAAKNHISVAGDPGRVSIGVFSSSLKERKLLEELNPTFVNVGKGIRVWEYEQPLTLLIKGEKESESWTLSHWKMFSGRVVFDLAKNKIRPTEDKPLSQPLPIPPDLNGDNHRPKDEDLDDATKKAIAEAQMDHGLRKNGGRSKRHARA